MVAKKVTRKELLREPDEFLTFSRRLFLWSVKNKGRLAMAFGGLLAVMILLAGAQYYSYRSGNKAFARLETLKGQYASAKSESDAGAAHDKVKTDFQDFLADYGGTEAGRLGRIYFADIAYAAGKADQAAALYEAALADYQDNPAFRNIILSGLGYAREALGEYAGAAESFQRIADGEYPVLKSEAVYNLGRLYQLLDQPEKSRAAYQRLVTDYADSIYADMVNEGLAG